MWLAVAAIVTTLTYCFVIYMNWPKWFVVFILIGLTGLIFLGKLIKMLWKMFFLKKSVQKIVEIEESELNFTDADKDNSKKLKKRLQNAIINMKNHPDLKYNKGNPIYVLPWYLIIGESGTGKTTAICSSGLGSQFSELHKIEGSGGTKDCDWWIFDTAIILDTAGRFTINVDKERDSKDWEVFLKHLGKYRKKEPINGIIVCVSAEKLQNNSKIQELKTDALHIRHRIKSVMEIVGAKFPIYILVTFCDKIEGMKTFADLPDINQEQAFGNINHSYQSTSIDEFLEKTMKKITNRLKDLRKISIHSSPDKLRDLILFPNEFEKLEDNLKVFVLEIFSKAQFPDPPILRGIFFSSSKQDGKTYSHFLEALGIKDMEEETTSSDNALFLHDFFSKILPFDRELNSPTEKYENKHKTVQRFFLITYFCIGLFICGILSTSFFMNYKALNDARTPPVLSEETDENLNLMKEYLTNILNIENQNRYWMIPRMGLDESKIVETKLKQLFCNHFRVNFLQPFDQQFEQEMLLFSPQTNGTKVGAYIFNLVRRIRLLQAFLETHESFDKIIKMPGINYISYNRTPETELIDLTINKQFSELYCYYMKWNSLAINNKEISELRRLLKAVITNHLKSFTWLLERTNTKKFENIISLSSFWGNLLLINDTDQSISSSFTKKGYASMLSDIEKIESVLDEDTRKLIKAIKKDLFSRDGEYPKRLKQHWKKFSIQLMQFSKHIKDRNEWYILSSKLGTDKCPYFSFLKKMADEVSPVVKDYPNSEDFLELSVLVKQVMHEAKQLQELSSGQSFQSKALTTLKRSAGKAGTLVNKRMIDAQMISAKNYQNYIKEIEKIRNRLKGNNHSAYALVQEAFRNNLSNNSPFTQAKKELRDLYSLLSISDNTIRSILEKPLNDLWNIAIKDTNCHLQEQWEERVLSTIAGYNSLPPVNELLCGDSGEVGKFVNTNLHPFIKKSSVGLIPKHCDIMNTSISIQAAAKKYIWKCIRYRKISPVQCPITIKCYPPRVNRSATKPNATHLIIRNSNSNQLTRLNYYGYIDQADFIWDSSLAPYETTIQIEVGNLSLRTRSALEIKYPTLQEFIKDFANGDHTFYPSDFPGRQSDLKTLNIHQCKIKYELFGVKCVTNLKKALPNPGFPSQELTTCW